MPRFVINPLTGAFDEVGSGGSVIPPTVISSWVVITTNQTMIAGRGYFANAVTGPAGLTALLPAVSAVGDTVKVYSMSSAGFAIGQPNAGTIIQLGKVVTTTGTGGNIIATKVGDQIELVCSIANTKWEAVSYNGNLIIN